MKPVKTALIQQECNLPPAEAREKCADAIHRAADRGAGLVVLPELHNGPYFCQQEDVVNFDLAEPIPGPSTVFFSRIAAERKVVLVLSLFERRAPGLYHNTAVVIDSDGRLAGRYRKMHIPDDPGFYEKFYFTPGDLGFRPIRTSIGNLGVLVCWDQWYPEAARLMALGGADLLVYPTAIGWDPRDDDREKERQLQAWLTVQRGHAVANGLPLVAVNRVGQEQDPAGATPGIDFWGNSFACGPQGEILASGGTEEADLLVEIDPRRSEEVRRIWPFLRDRRIECYGDLLKRFLDED
ncbi:N-carbamoylputrescine amidase [Geothermobacter ehrlichii]|uniref:N-carbamoylputrescine amidase n=1 Tax=Geothermobacter ehrlichii TaxID=213224 RepID=A0A5D3WMX7_9BACT|nr:carbon-nitrogen hydrolase [Geothermobacter ehrlichii]TYO99921.1 N-carbamoylputrescine amidase [Geothermobacter ehrlichii]